MKKLVFSSIILLFALSACNNKQPQKEQVVETDSVTAVVPKPTKISTKADALSVQRIELQDSMPPLMPEDIEDEYKENLHYTLTLDLPTGDDIVSDSIRRYIFSEVEQKSDNENLETAFKKNAKKFFTEETDGWNGCALEMSFTKTFENDKIVTFTKNCYWYGGGAHGSTTITGVSFCKKTGKRIGWDIFRTTDGLADLILSKLPNYFQVENEDDVFEELLNIEEEGKLPLPQTQPWIENDSIYFLYQQYEIACYAAGMPNCAFSFDELKDFLVNFK